MRRVAAHNIEAPESVLARSCSSSAALRCSDRALAGPTVTQHRSPTTAMKLEPKTVCRYPAQRLVLDSICYQDSTAAAQNNKDGTVSLEPNQHRGTNQNVHRIREARNSDVDYSLHRERIKSSYKTAARNSTYRENLLLPLVSTVQHLYKRQQQDSSSRKISERRHISTTTALLKRRCLCDARAARTTPQPESKMTSVTVSLGQHG